MRSARRMRNNGRLLPEAVARARGVSAGGGREARGGCQSRGAGAGGGAARGGGGGACGGCGGCGGGGPKTSSSSWLAGAGLAAGPVWGMEPRLVTQQNAPKPCRRNNAKNKKPPAYSTSDTRPRAPSRRPRPAAQRSPLPLTALTARRRRRMARSQPARPSPRRRPSPPSAPHPPP